MPTPPVQHVPDSSRVEPRPWQRPATALAFPAGANDNRPLARPRRAKRGLGIKGLLDWTYRLQRAHRILRGPTDWFLWAMDAAGMVDVPADRRQLHHDAAVVHEAVLSLGTDTAALVIEMAATGLWPEPIEDLEPIAYPLEPSDRYDEFKRYVRNDGTRFTYLIRTIEHVAIPREEYELVGRRKMQRAKAAGYDRVPVLFCPIRWDPEIEFVEAQRRRAVLWAEACDTLCAALAAAPFRDHVLIANDNDAVPPDAANDNPSQEK